MPNFLTSSVMPKWYGQYQSNSAFSAYEALITARNDVATSGELMNGGAVIRLSYGTDKYAEVMEFITTPETATVPDASVEMCLQNASTQSRLEETGRRNSQSTGDIVMAGTCSDVKYV